MCEAPDPILRQFAVPPNRGNGTLALEVDPSTGLLHESGVNIPVVEEIIAMGVRWRNFDAAGSLLTETADPVDPDLIRADSAWMRFSEAMETVLTKTLNDPIDPDVVRAAWLRWATESVGTVITRDLADEPDPDLVRAELLRASNHNAAVDRTRVGGEHPDLDLTALEIVHDKQPIGR